MKEVSADDVVIRSVAETAIYINPNNDVVIRQECWGDDDSVVIIPVEYISRFIRALSIAERDAIALERG